MKLEQSFEVQAPLQRVWEALIDVERVAPCLPGASVTGRNPDGSYNGEFKVKIGPTSAAYSGKLQMEDVDEAKHSATMQAAGTDKRGQGGAKATIVSSVSEAAGGATTVHVDTDYHITGRLARFGRGGMIEEISNRLLGEFAGSLQGMLAGSATDEPAAAAQAQAEAEVEAAESATTEAAAEPAAAVPTETAQPAASPPPETPPSEPAGSAQRAGTPTPTPAPNGARAATPPPADPVAPPTPPRVGPTQESQPLDGLSLMGTVLLNRVKSNPVPLIGVLVGFLVAVRVRRQRRS